MKPQDRRLVLVLQKLLLRGDDDWSFHVREMVRTSKISVASGYSRVLIWKGMPVACDLLGGLVPWLDQGSIEGRETGLSRLSYQTLI